MGMGGVWRDRVYATPVHNLGGLNVMIVHPEMLSIVNVGQILVSFYHHSSL